MAENSLRREEIWFDEAVKEKEREDRHICYCWRRG